MDGFGKPYIKTQVDSKHQYVAWMRDSMPRHELDPEKVWVTMADKRKVLLEFDAANEVDDGQKE